MPETPYVFERVNVRVSLEGPMVKYIRDHERKHGCVSRVIRTALTGLYRSGHLDRMLRQPTETKMRKVLFEGLKNEQS